MSSEGATASGPIGEGELRLTNAIAFVRFLKGPEVNESAELVGLSRSGAEENVRFSIQVPVPQFPSADIRGVETIEAVFGEGEPHVFALREGFPRLPHQNLTGKGSARSLCLNATGWSETKHRWSPSSFLENIRDWLIKASLGKLHAPGQPREPLFAHPVASMIVDEDFDLSQSDMIKISGDTEHTPFTLWATSANAGTQPGRGNFRLFSFRVPSREHGVIDTRPDNLLELHELCAAQGLDLIPELAAQLKAIAPAGRLGDTIFAHQMLLHLQQELTPGAGSEETTDEEWAFMVMDGNIQKVAELLEVSTLANGNTAPVLVPITPDPVATAQVPIAPIAILRSMTPEKARQHNDVSAPLPGVAVLGAGALGSKVVENLARAGLEEAVIIDHDRLYPHNVARHSLPATAAGFPKSTSFALHLSTIINANPSERFKGIVGSFSAGNLSDEVAEALKASRFILDFSASVAVSRDLSAESGYPRAFSTFLTPGGDALVIHCEDSARTTRLDWLEAITLRAILLSPELHTCYRSATNEIWYGGGCREVSTVLPNYKVSMFAALASNAFIKRHADDRAYCSVHVLDPETMGVTPVAVTPTTPVEAVRGGWTIRYDQELVETLQEMRQQHLPNETGGILVGVFDRERRICSIVMASDSPPDSESWPTEYIRGVAGLKELVQQVADLTAGQLQYVGEWHSHPRGYSASPSSLDREAVANLKMILGREGYPAVALIIGEDPLPYVLFDQLE